MIPVFLLDKPHETAIYQAVAEHLLHAFPDVTLHPGKTQLGFGRQVQFAWVWLPRRKADAGALMVSFSLPVREESPRVAWTIDVRPGRVMHHVPVRSAEEVDGELLRLLEASYVLGGLRMKGGERK